MNFTFIFYENVTCVNRKRDVFSSFKERKTWWKKYWHFVLLFFLHQPSYFSFKLRQILGVSVCFLKRSLKRGKKPFAYLRFVKLLNKQRHLLIDSICHSIVSHVHLKLFFPFLFSLSSSFFLPIFDVRIPTYRCDNYHMISK